MCIYNPMHIIIILHSQYVEIYKFISSFWTHTHNMSLVCLAGLSRYTIIINLWYEFKRFKLYIDTTYHFYSTKIHCCADAV